MRENRQDTKDKGDDRIRTFDTAQSCILSASQSSLIDDITAEQENKHDIKTNLQDHKDNIAQKVTQVN